MQALSVWVWVEATPLPYLIFFMNAVNAVRVNFLGECKKIPEEPEKYRFWQFRRKFTHFPSVKFSWLKMCACKKMTNIRHGHVLLEHLWRKKSKMKWKAKMASSATAFEVVLPHQTLPEQPFVYNHHFTTTAFSILGKWATKDKSKPSWRKHHKKV